MTPRLFFGDHHFSPWRGLASAALFAGILVAHACSAKDGPAAKSGSDSAAPDGTDSGNPTPPDTDTGDPEPTDTGDPGPTDTGDPPTAACPDVGGFDNFITRDGAKLYDGDEELRFISFNVPNLHILEDASWHLPDPWEQEDALCSVVHMGGQVVRIYTLSVGDSGTDVPRHITAPGELTEELFVAFDQMLALANQTGVRLIVPFVDQWSFWGGITEYAGFRGVPAEEFWTNEEVKADFKATIEAVLTRTNTLTGVAYRDDPAILAWETGNELYAPSEWTAEMAAFIKELDTQHLVLDGHYGVDPASLDNPDIDIVSNHYYSPLGFGEDYAGAAMSDVVAVEGQRPFIVGEFGLVGTEYFEALLDVVEAEAISGAMIWSLRFHDVGGGFYWHTEVDSETLLVRAYHWPGFDSGEAYDERGVLALMRDRAFSIQGRSPPVLDPLVPPTLHAFLDVTQITWQGSTGAGWYQLERADAEGGPWEVVVTDFDDAKLPNSAVVHDTTAVDGAVYYYRLRAGNEAGISAPSEVYGPITTVVSTALIDDLDDLSYIESHSDGLDLDTTNPENFEGDSSRLTRTEASDQWLRYTVDGAIRGFEVVTYFWPHEDALPLEFSMGTGEDLIEYPLEGSEEGGDWVREIYRAGGLSDAGNTLEIRIPEHGGNIWNPQISRVRIDYGG